MHCARAVALRRDIDSCDLQSRFGLFLFEGDLGDLLAVEDHPERLRWTVHDETDATYFFAGLGNLEILIGPTFGSF